MGDKYSRQLGTSVNAHANLMRKYMDVCKQRDDWKARFDALWKEFHRTTESKMDPYGCPPWAPGLCPKTPFGDEEMVDCHKCWTELPIKTDKEG
jgi:hypothetical protein